MTHVLGIKREQIEGVRNPGEDTPLNLQAEGDHIRALAERFLATYGKNVPQPALLLEEAPHGV
jgi:hypothetical protein